MSRSFGIPAGLLSGVACMVTRSASLMLIVPIEGKLLISPGVPRTTRHDTHARAHAGGTGAPRPGGHEVATRAGTRGLPSSRAFLTGTPHIVLYYESVHLSFRWRLAGRLSMPFRGRRGKALSRASACRWSWPLSTSVLAMSLAEREVRLLHDSPRSALGMSTPSDVKYDFTPANPDPGDDYDKFRERSLNAMTNSDDRGWSLSDHLLDSFRTTRRS